MKLLVEWYLEKSLLLSKLKWLNRLCRVYVDPTFYYIKVMITNDIYYNEINRLKNIVANSLKYRNVPVVATDNAYKNLVKLYSEHEIDIVINEMIDNPDNPMWDVLLLDLLANQDKPDFWELYADAEIQVTFSKI